MIKKPTYEKLGHRIQEFEGMTVEQEKKDIAIAWLDERFKSFLNNIQAAVVLHAPDTRIIASNIEAQNLLGLVENKIIGKTVSDSYWKFIDTDGRKLPLEMYPVNLVLRHRRPLRDYTLGMYHPDKKKIVWALVNAKPEFNDKDDIEYIVVTFVDITERMNAEQKLGHSKLRLDAIFDNIDSAIYIADMESHEILFMNNHIKKLFGNDLTGNICWKSLHENMGGPCEFCTNNNLTDADGNPTGPYVWENYNQTLGRWYELHDLAIPWLDGRLVRMEIATDITDRKQVELQQKEMNEILEKKVQDRTANLEEMNSALTVLLKKRDDDKNDLEKNIFANYKSLISPFLLKLNDSLTTKNQQVLMGIVESNLKEILSPFSKKLSDPMISFTPAEIQIASFIKRGITTKEIAKTLNCSPRTIDTHRINIRKKLNIKNKNINLRTFLLSLE